MIKKLLVFAFFGLLLLGCTTTPPKTTPTPTSPPTIAPTATAAPTVDTTDIEDIENEVEVLTDLEDVSADVEGDIPTEGLEE